MKRLLILVFSVLSLASFAAPSEGQPATETAFNPGEVIMHHVGDSHEWHFATIGDAHHGTHVTLPLPIIAYRADKGLSVFSSAKLAHGQSYEGLKLDHEHLIDESGAQVTDLSITKNVAALLLSVVVLMVVFFTVAASYTRNRGKAPSGMQSFFEPIIVFIRDEIAQKAIGPKYERYVPYLLTIFFFIWFNNLLGLMPGGANLTGNIAVTLTLAVLTLVITLASSNKYYWSHILWTPGVPLWLRPIMLPVELIGIVTKPFSLMIRLFANITAGHIIILSLISLIFIFESVAVSPVTVAFGIFMNFMELFVALLQAYIFTLLTAMYIGGAVEEHHDSDYGIGGDDSSAPLSAH